MVAILARLGDVRLIRYLIASVGALAVDVGCFLALLALGTWPATASAIGYCAGIVAHWLLSSRAVFADSVAARGMARMRQKTMFVLSALLGLGLTAGIVWAGDAAGLDPRGAKLVAIALSFAATWVLRSRDRVPHRRSAMTRSLAAPGRFPLGRVALVWAAIAAMLVLAGLSDIAARKFHDPDDILRLVQVRDLLAGQAWFDLHQYRIDPPQGTLMHWSRLVDAPLALVIAALTPLLGQHAARSVAIVAIPLLTLGTIVLAVARIAARVLDGTEGVTLACLCLGISPLLLNQVAPLRIDHHGWQIAAVAWALLGLLPGRPERGAALSGLALAVGLSISLEVLPIAVAFGGVFALRWLADGRTRAPLVTYLATLAGALGLLFLATRGFADLAAHCDAISPPYLGAIVLTALGTGGVARLQSRSRPCCWGCSRWWPPQRAGSTCGRRRSARAGRSARSIRWCARSGTIRCSRGRQAGASRPKRGSR